jgi:hypothetical protein
MPKKKGILAKHEEHLKLDTKNTSMQYEITDQIQDIPTYIRHRTYIWKYREHNDNNKESQKRKISEQS